jgi:phosphomannomutase
MRENGSHHEESIHFLFPFPLQTPDAVYAAPMFYFITSASGKKTVS